MATMRRKKKKRGNDSHIPAQDKKRRSQEAFRSSEHGPVKEGKEQPHPRNMDRRGYKFFDKDMKDMYDELLKHDKIIH